MKAATYSVHLHWDRRYPKAGTIDLCPVQLGVRIDNVSFKVGLRLYATNEDFQKAMLGKAGTAEQKELRREINKYVTKAEEVLKNLPNPTRSLFQRVFKSETDLFTSSNRCSVDFHFALYIDMLRKEERFGTADMYTNALRSLKAYKDKLFFEEINADFLRGFRKWNLDWGGSITTSQMYMRCLRAIFNKAIKDGFIARRFYPFNDFVIGTSVKSKKVLYPDQVRALLNCETKTLRERRALDYFKMCYLSGANFKDIAYLKWKNIQRETIVFVREKTKRTNTVAGKEVRAYLHPELRRIIEELGVKSNDPEAFIFPILHGRDSVEGMEKRRDRIQRQINDKLKILGKRAGLDVDVILNIARHSFSTNLKLSGTPIAFIQDALGHASITTTQYYLKSIPDQHLKVMSQSLLDFKDDNY